MTVTLITFLHFPHFVSWFASAIVILEMPEFTTQVWSDFMQPHCICSPQFPNPAPASVPAGFECSWIWPGPAPSGLGKLESSASLFLVESDTCSVYRGKTVAPGNCSGNGAKVCSVTAVTGSANTVTLREWGKHAAKICQPHRGDSASAGILSFCSLHTNCVTCVQYMKWQIQKFWRGGGDNLSAPSSFIANAHNEIYAFYAEKSGFLTKIWANRGGAPTAPPPFESATATYTLLLNIVNLTLCIYTSLYGCELWHLRMYSGKLIDFCHTWTHGRNALGESEACLITLTSIPVYCQDPVNVCQKWNRRVALSILFVDASITSLP